MIYKASWKMSSASSSRPALVLIRYRIEGKKAVTQLAQQLASLVPLSHVSLFVQGEGTGPMFKKLKETGERIV